MGTPELSVTILEHLLHRQTSVVAVYTQADKPVGRKQELQASPVKLSAERFGLPIEQPLRWNAETLEHLRSYRPDLIIVAAYGKILPQAMLDMPRFKCVNVHASLLPRWRGASPVQNTILAGDTTTGVTLMLMDKGMDTGDILTQASLPLDGTETTPSLLEALSALALPLLAETIPRWINGSIQPQPQDNTGVTLCQLIDREDGRIFWNESVEVLERKYRALTPWPGLFFFWQRATGTLRVKLLEANFQSTPHQKPIGTVFVTEHGDMAIQCDGGLILPITLHVEGKKPVSAKEFLSGYPECLTSRF